MAASRVRKKLGRPKGSKTGSGAAQPMPFTIARALVGHGWLVKQGKNWRRAGEVSILVPVLAIGGGEIVGLGVVSRHGGTIRITG